MARRTSTRKGDIPPFVALNDLTSSKVGTRILFATDDWFAAAENLLKVEPAEWREGFTECGKWMDGWETRRKRTAGHDWCIIELGLPGRIEGFDVDTSYFTGNYAPRVSIQGINAKAGFRLPPRGGGIGKCASKRETTAAEAIGSQKWEVLVPMTPLKPGYEDTCHNYLKVQRPQICTHLRLNLFPDGGVARLRAYGVIARDWSMWPKDKLVDLAAMENGGQAIACSDAHFGHPRNLIGLGRADNMGDGWETARKLSRPPIFTTGLDGTLQTRDSDWAVIKLCHAGEVSEIEIDTNHFKGNFPSSCKIEGCFVPGGRCGESMNDLRGVQWKALLPSVKLSAHKQHYFRIHDAGVFSHIRLTIVPDGGVSRLRIRGFPHVTARL